VDELAAVATRAEDAGFDSIWLTDHLLVPPELAGAYGTIAEALVTLGFLAGSTTRIRLGVSALVVPQRHPLVTLKQVTSLDFLSGGRLVLAVAPGWLEEEFETLGAEFEQRGSRLDDWLALATAAFAQMPGPIEYEGTPSLRGGWLAPGLTRVAAIEVWVAGGGEAALRRAARAGVWHPVALPLGRFAELAARFRERRPDGRVVMRLSTLLREVPEPDGVDERGRHAVVGPPGWITERLTEYVRNGCDGFVVNLGHDAPGLADRAWRFMDDVWPLVAAG
jgi:alkanesulfonate monooxygenase SsuD/methylene tetrahydromethanopterin reductase-like flavin-dependent oxidoreductase (luciferase family)